MRLTESQLTRVLDQLRGYHLLLNCLAQISECTDARLLARDADQLLCELERVTIDDDIENVLGALEVRNV